MAAVKTLVGHKLLIQIGDGATPEVFTHDCLINGDRGFTFSSDSSESVTPDCDDPTLPGWKELFKEALSLEVSGGGKLHTTSEEVWFNWFNSDTAKNVRIKKDVTGALGGGYYSCAMKLTGFSVTSSRKETSEVDVTLQSHGTVTWVDNA